jgi:hypothetical protein
MSIGMYELVLVDSRENKVLYNERYDYGADGRIIYSDKEIKDIDFIPPKSLLRVFI